MDREVLSSEVNMRPALIAIVLAVGSARAGIDNLGTFTVTNGNVTANFAVPALPPPATLSGTVTLTGLTIPDSTILQASTFNQGTPKFRHTKNKYRRRIHALLYIVSQSPR